MFAHFPPRSPLLSLISVSCLVWGFAALLLILGPPGEVRAEIRQTLPVNQLADFSLEELMQIQVYSVSKQPENIFTAAAAIYVISADDIRQSGVTSLPEALRLAPGVHVARMDGNKWAISIRGFAGRFSNKLLVLQDGRTIYNPMFSGVYWSAQEVMLEDIEQIEVIRGPGATLWGANAVNGVINITTKHAKNSQGGLITASGGTWERAATGIRYGTRSGENGYIRAYGKFFYRDSLPPPAESPNLEGYWNDWRGGFHGDWALNSQNNVTLQGDYYESRTGIAQTRGGNLLVRWNSTFSDTSNLSLQLWYDRNSLKNRVDPDTHHHEARDTGDLELQHTFALGDLQTIVWGSGFRLTSDLLNSDASVNPAFLPGSKTDLLFSVFLQDKVILIPEILHLILGSRLEHNDMTGWECQPTARLLWTPHKQHTLWSAVTRAVRTPSRAETTISARVGFIPPETEIRLVGNSRLPSEKMIAYEAGYRYQPLTSLSVDLALFYNQYDTLIGLVEGTPHVGASSSFVPISVNADSTAIGRGGELSMDWHPLHWLNLALTYSFLDLSVSFSASPPQNRIIMNADTSPRHQFSFRSTLSLPKNVTCTFWLRYVDSLPGPGVPDYVTFDARVGWKPLPNLELSLVGQNLLEQKHMEFGPDMFNNPSTETRRSMHGKVSWSF
ncbi:MAG: TonB-dependent receptor [Desulfuromonadales bacterium]